MELFGNNLNKNKQSGFTLIELLFALGIFALLIIASIPSYHAIKENVALRNNSNEITRALRKAQNDSIIAKGGAPHGVHFASTSYTVFEGASWNEGTPIIEYRLVQGIKIIAGENTDIVFDRLTGETASTSIEVGLSEDNKKTIQVDEVGSVIIKD